MYVRLTFFRAVRRAPAFGAAARSERPAYDALAGGSATFLVYRGDRSRKKIEAMPHYSLEAARSSSECQHDSRSPRPLLDPTERHHSQKKRRGLSAVCTADVHDKRLAFAIDYSAVYDPARVVSIDESSFYFHVVIDFSVPPEPILRNGVVTNFKYI
jgi:hypothetical protein